MIIEKFKINLKVGYLLVVFYEECDFKMFVLCIISSYKCVTADMKNHSHAYWRGVNGNRVYIGDSESQHLISLNVVFKRE